MKILPYILKGYTSYASIAKELGVSTQRIQQRAKKEGVSLPRARKHLKEEENRIQRDRYLCWKNILIEDYFLENFKYKGERTNYYVSWWGDVYSDSGKKFEKLHSSRNKTGYKRFTLTIKGKYIQFYGHHLVASLFLPKSKEQEDQIEGGSPVCIKFKDGNRSNIHVTNLEWQLDTNKTHMNGFYPERVLEEDNLYLIETDDFIKCGRSFNPELRMKSLEKDSGFNFTIIGLYKGTHKQVYTLEQKIKHKMTRRNLHYFKEPCWSGSSECYKKSALHQVRELILSSKLTED